MMTSSSLRSLLPWLAAASAVFVTSATNPADHERPAAGGQESEAEPALHVRYLEIVTPDVKATCDTLEELHGVTFGEPVAELGNARTAALHGGGRISVRAPMHAGEEPVVRPYILVDDVAAAAETAMGAGGEIAVPPMELPGHGKFALYFQGGNQYGLWQD